MTARAFPAPAGMNRRDAGGAWSSAGVPRARGDEPDEFGSIKNISRRSPRLRG